MPDIVVRHIDHLLAERIHSLAKARQWTINDVLLHALRRGMGMTENGPLAEALLEADELGGQWNASEQAAFLEAMQALSTAHSGQLATAPR